MERSPSLSAHRPHTPLTLSKCNATNEDFATLLLKLRDLGALRDRLGRLSLAGAQLSQSRADETGDLKHESSLEMERITLASFAIATQMLAVVPGHDQRSLRAAIRFRGQPIAIFSELAQSRLREGLENIRNERVAALTRALKDVKWPVGLAQLQSCADDLLVRLTSSFVDLVQLQVSSSLLGRTESHAGRVYGLNRLSLGAGRFV